MVYTVPDCLVLKIQEIESHTNKIDTVIYIIYNNLLKVDKPIIIWFINKNI